MSGAEQGIAPRTIEVLDHGFVRLDDAMASDLSVVNAARVSFARRKEEMDDSDVGLVRFLMRDRHGTPFEHNAFRFHVRAPLFVAREWFRHRIGCLTGDTEVTFVDINGHTSRRLRKTIDELWKMWDEGEANGHALPVGVAADVSRRVAAGESIRAIARATGHGRRAITAHLRGRNARRDARWRLRRMRLRVLNEATNEFEVGQIAAVVEKGVQPVYRLTLADGRQLTLTENHQVLTDDGWRTMRAAVGLVGDGCDARMTRVCSLLVNGTFAYRDREWLRLQRAAGLSVAEIAAEAGCSYHTVRKWLARHGLGFAPGEAARGREAWNKERRYSTGRSITPAHREAIRRVSVGILEQLLAGWCHERASVDCPLDSGAGRSGA